MSDRTETITHGDISITVTRRTNLTKGRFGAIVGKIAAFYTDLAARLNEAPGTVDEALSDFARMSAQTESAEGIEYLRADDDVKTIERKCMAYLTDYDVTLCDRWLLAVRRLSQPWNDPALTPVAENTDPEADAAAS